MNLALKMLSVELDEARKRLRFMLSRGFKRDGLLVGGYKRRVQTLRLRREDLAQRLERES